MNNDDIITFDRSAAGFMLEAFNEPGALCVFCGKEVHEDNLAGFIKKDNKTVLLCSSLSCLIKLAKKHAEVHR